MYYIIMNQSGSTFVVATAKKQSVNRELKGHLEACENVKHITAFNTHMECDFSSYGDGAYMVVGGEEMTVKEIITKLEIE